MVDRKSSDAVATAASHIMRGTPIDDDGVLNLIIQDVRDALTKGTQAEARDKIRLRLADFNKHAKTLAASVVSQADGRE